MTRPPHNDHHQIASGSRRNSPRLSAMDPVNEPDIRHALSLRSSPFHPRDAHEHDHSRHRRESHSQSHTPRQDHQPFSPPSTTEPTIVRENKLPTSHTTGFDIGDEATSDTIARHVSGATATDRDLETGPTPIPNDPYRLATRIKSVPDIDAARSRLPKKKGPLAFLSSGASQSQARKLRSFYQEQNENIERLLKPVADHVREARDAQGDNELKFKIAVYGSLTANVVLAALQLYAAAASGSLALFTTMADALFDPMSNIMLFVTHRMVNKIDARRFPVGKSRIETTGNICFCFLMTAVSLIIIVQSIRFLVEGSENRTNDFHMESIIAVSVAFFVKLALFLYCFALRNMHSQIRILWEDHRNDLIINATGVMFSLLGSKVRWWIDPMGAIIISCLIIVLWLRTAKSEFMLLIGVSADPSMLQLITYIGTLFCPSYFSCYISSLTSMMKQ